MDMGERLEEEEASEVLYVPISNLPGGYLPHTSVKDRIRAELTLVRNQLWTIIPCGAYLFYFTTIVFRNLAFYRFKPAPLLQDIGHDTIPYLDDSRWWCDLPLYFVTGVMASMCLATFFGNNQKVQKPYAVNIGLRFLEMLCIGHTLRFFTYISTSYPGTSMHCRPENVGKINPPSPQTLYEVFIGRVALAPGANCGDLLFSGHIFGIVTPSLIIGKYGMEAFQYGPRIHRCICVILCLAVALQCVFVVGRRNHYTADVVVALYLTPFLWNFYVNEIRKQDAAP